MLKEVNGIIYRYDDSAKAGDVPVTIIDWRKTARIFQEKVVVPALSKDVAGDTAKAAEAIISKYVTEKAAGKAPEEAILEARK